MVKLSPLAHKADAHNDAVWCCAWTADGETLITGSVDEAVVKWRAGGEGLDKAHTYEGHTLGVVSVAMSTNGLAASSALDSNIRVWELESGETKAVIEALPSESWEISFEPVPDPRHIAVAGGSSRTVKLYDLGSGAVASTMSLPEVPAAEKSKGARFVQSVTYSSDGKRLACGAMDGTVAIFDVERGALLHTLEGHAMPVRSVAFSPDCRTLFTACDDGHVHMYDAEHKSLLEALSGHKSWVLGVACSPQGGAVVSCSSDATVKLWDLGQRSCVQTMSDHKDAVWGVSFRPDGSRLASVSDDKSVSIYDFV